MPAPPRPVTDKGPKTVAGILAFVGALLVIVACAVPFVKFSIGDHTQTSSIFDLGPDTPKADYWFLVEPIGVILFAILGGLLVLASGRGRMRAVAAGGLIVLGIQSLFLFTGYALGYLSEGNQVGPGGPIGMVAGVLLAVSGFIALAAKPTEEAGQAPGTAGPAAGAGTAAPAYQPPYPGQGYS
jgi:hypothetical protein